MSARELECLECGAAVTLPEDVMEREILSCGECGVEWEVVKGEPWELVRAPDVEEDWGE